MQDPLIKKIPRLFRLRPVRYMLIPAVDGLIAWMALNLAIFLRFEEQVPERYLEVLPQLLALVIGARITATVLFRLHRWSFHFSGLADAMRLGLAALFGSGLFLLALYFLRIQAPPRSTVILEFFVSATLMGLIRFLPRLAFVYRADRIRSQRADTVRTLIIGAGAAGEMLLRDLRRSDEHSYKIIGFVDDDPSKWGTIVGGRPTLGGIDDLPRLVERHAVDRVLIAIPRPPAHRVREILALCSHLKVRFKILPVSYIYLQESASAAVLQDLRPEDLLAREQVDFSRIAEAENLSNHTVMVTGAAGSIGREICTQLLAANVAHLVMVDLDENGLYMARRRFETEFDDKIFTEVANIRDRRRVEALLAKYRPHDVFHAAAHKHVPLMEASPCEAVKNNVLGTQIVAETADRFGCRRFVLISTDKAVRPSNIMGATKGIAELIVRSISEDSDTSYCSVRFGNVLGSAGSVVPIFREQIAARRPLTVTHPEARRYFMTIHEAVGMVLKAAYGGYSGLCVLEMGEQIKIFDLARHMITMAGLVPEVDIPIQFTGLRPGEKLYEELLTDEEAASCRVEESIRVSAGTVPPPSFAPTVARLIEAARAEDEDTTIRILRELVPSYGSTEAALDLEPVPPTTFANDRTTPPPDPSGTALQESTKGRRPGQIGEDDR